MVGSAPAGSWVNCALDHREGIVDDELPAISCENGKRHDQTAHTDDALGHDLIVSRFRCPVGGRKLISHPGGAPGLPDGDHVLGRLRPGLVRDEIDVFPDGCRRRRR
jgi:hypothetical protein